MPNTIKVGKDELAEVVAGVITDKTRDLTDKVDGIEGVIDAKLQTIKDEIKNEIKSEKTKSEFPDVIADEIKTSQIAVKPDNKYPIGKMMLATAQKQMGKFANVDDAIKHFGREPSNYLSQDVRDAIDGKSLNTSVSSDGGFLIADTIVPEFVPLLEAASVVRNSGVPVFNTPTGNATFNRMTTGSTGYWIGENDNATPSNEKFDQIVSTVKKGVVQVPISNDLLRYTSMLNEAGVQNEMIGHMSRLQDIAFLKGTGSAYQPKGMLLWAGTTTNGTSTATAAQIKSDLITKAAALLSADNVPIIKPTWFMSPKLAWHIKKQVDANSNAMDYAKEFTEQGTLLGYPVEITTHMINTNIFLVDVGYCTIIDGQSVSLEFEQNGTWYESGAVQSGTAKDMSVFTVRSQTDFIVKHPKAIAVIDSLNWV